MKTFVAVLIRRNIYLQSKKAYVVIRWIVSEQFRAGLLKPSQLLDVLNFFFNSLSVQILPINSENICVCSNSPIIRGIIYTHLKIYH